MNRGKLCGVMSAAVTPVCGDGSIDRGAVGALMDYYAENGISGALWPSSTGEYFALTGAKRRDCVSAAAGHNPHGLTVLANISEGSLEAAMENARAMADLGADAAVLMPPQFHHHTQDELVDYYTRAADQSPIPLIIYNHMTRLPSKVEIPTVMKLKDHPNLWGIKDTHNDAARLMTLSTLIGEDEDFVIMAGGDGMAGYSAIFHMEMLNALSSIRPDLFVEMYRAGRAGDLRTVSLLQQRVNRLMGVFTALKGGKSSAALFSQAVKAALSMKGLCGTKAVQLGYELDQSDLDSVKRVLDTV